MFVKVSLNNDCLESDFIWNWSCSCINRSELGIAKNGENKIVSTNCQLLYQLDWFVIHFSRHIKKLIVKKTLKLSTRLLDYQKQSNSIPIHMRTIATEICFLFTKSICNWYIVIIDYRDDHINAYRNCLKEFYKEYSL